MLFCPQPVEISGAIEEDEADKGNAMYLSLRLLPTATVHEKCIYAFSTFRQQSIVSIAESNETSGSSHSELLDDRLYTSNSSAK